MKINVTELLAIWGAVLSSVTFGWNLLRDLRDRPSVVLQGTIGKIVHDKLGRPYFLNMTYVEKHGTRNSESKTQFKLTITNTGRRPVRIEAWGGICDPKMSKDVNLRHMSIGLPKMLEEGESHDELSPEPLRILSDSVKSIVAWDSAGRDWKLPRKQLKRLKQEAKNLAEKGEL
jgi:hypothetical protein